MILKQDNGEIMTCGELEKIGECLTEDIEGRSLTFLLCSNTIGSVMGYLSFIRHRIPVVLLASDISQEMLQRLMEIYHPAYVWLPCKEKHKISGDMIYKAYSYFLVRTDYIDYTSIYEELAILVSTSGSTGSPKMVRLSYRNLYQNAKSIADYLKIDTEERPITTLPMNYAYGLSIINSHVYAGATILLTSKTFLEASFWEFFFREKATSFGGVPYTYEMLDRLNIYQMSLPSLKTMTQAGGKLPVGLQKRFAGYAAKTGKQFIVMYGASEATARMAYLPTEYSLKKQGSIGIPIPGGTFKLYDDNDQEITEPDREGELIYIGDNVSLGYALGRKDLSKGDGCCGYLRTGDMARFDEDGFYYITGRKKRFLKLFGHRVNLDEIDQLIYHRFDQVEAVSHGKDDMMVLFITDPSVEDRLREYLLELLGIPQRALKIKILEAIPRNESGKVLYRELDTYIG